MMRLLIYCPQVTPRIKYIFNFIFREVLLCDFELISIAADFTASDQPKFSYAEKPLGDELFFCCSSLLAQHKMQELTHQFAQFGDQRVPFAVDQGALPFDVFAASFYFLSRYEEYLPFSADEHGRFPAESSLLHQLGLLDTPVIDNWAMILKNMLLQKYPRLTFGKRKFQFIPTIDVDRAYHFKSSGLVKNTARIFRAAANLNAEKIFDIIKTGLGQHDPFDTYHYLSAKHAEYGLKPIFFFLLAKHGHQEFDQNINREEEIFKNLIIDVAKEAQVGLHPSYASSTETKKINEELVFLQALTQRKIDSSRQHFLKIHLPHTYLQLLKVGINHDYSMGYASQLGFRAGTCTSFFWYDLQLEKQTQLKVYPFAVMDVTLQQYLKLDPAAAIQKIGELISNVKLVDGLFCSLWHNESLSETGRWKGWKKVYEEMLAMA
ncbi:MAG: polysaccharide deacetylase family protein [Pedobacter sp.]|nr:polysaccharide deacetylase family protein [Pedobacter sp.]MDQ8052854.1 polysaccharide deacetylase family protein [Pedobacter sp.]